LFPRAARALGHRRGIAAANPRDSVCRRRPVRCRFERSSCAARRASRVGGLGSRTGRLLPCAHPAAPAAAAVSHAPSPCRGCRKRVALSRNHSVRASPGLPACSALERRSRRDDMAPFRCSASSANRPSVILRTLVRSSTMYPSGRLARPLHRARISPRTYGPPVNPLPPKVIIVGGGVAALEALIALSDLAPQRIAVSLVAPGPDFVYRPQRWDRRRDARLTVS
jgi:hypothetical protein